METNNKTLASIITDQKQQITQIINNSKLEPIIWHYILKDFLEEIDILLVQEQQKQFQQTQEVNQENN